MRQIMKKGFFQLVNTNTNLVTSQREGVQSQEEFIRTQIWRVEHPYKLVFVENSDYCHPSKFFNAIRKDEVISLYSDVFCPEEAKTMEPSWVGQAKDIEKELAIEGQYLEFVALTGSGEWVGTSEF